MNLDSLRKYKDKSYLTDEAFAYIKDMIDKPWNITQNFLDVNSHFLKDKDVVLYALKREIADILPFLRYFHDNTEIMTIAVSQNSKAFRVASTRLRDSVELTKIAIQRDPDTISAASPRILREESIVLELIKLVPKIIAKTAFSDYFYDHKEFCLIAATLGKSVFKDISERLRDDEDVCRIGMETTFEVFNLCSARLRADRDFAHYALDKSIWNIRHITNPELLNDWTFMEEAAKSYFPVIKEIGQSVREEPKIMPYSKNMSMADWSVYLKAIKDEPLSLDTIRMYYQTLPSLEKREFLVQHANEVVKDWNNGMTSTFEFKREHLDVIDWVLDGLETELIDMPIRNEYLKEYVDDELSKRKIDGISKQEAIKKKKLRKVLS